MVPHFIDVSSKVEPQEGWGQVGIRFDDVEEDGKLLDSNRMEISVREMMTKFSEKVGVRKVRVPFQEGGLRALENWSGFRVLLEVGVDDVGSLDDSLPMRWEKAARSVWVIPKKDTAERMLEVVRSSSLKGYPVLLPPDPCVLKGDKELLLGALEHYLFSRELRVPIDPFHSLLRSGVQRLEKSNLLRIWTGPPEDYFYIDGSGMVSICPDWIEKGKIFGQSSEPVSKWKESEDYGEFLRKLEAHPEPDTLCGRCPHSGICGGGLLLFHEDAACEVWMELFERVKLAAETLIEKRGGGQKKRQGLGHKRGRRGRAGGTKAKGEDKGEAGKNEGPTKGNVAGVDSKRSSQNPGRRRRKAVGRCAPRDPGEVTSGHIERGVKANDKKEGVGNEIPSTGDRIKTDSSKE